ncbi:MAG: DISARM system phospholipase D-like protein DrmC [Acidobacteria bacterium]|nr:DISARM system phospholipase D-like protein DrmC [Acidobacteriota bacterium]
MTAAFPKLSDADIRELANALKSRRVSEPYSELQVNRILSPKSAQNATQSLQELAVLGFDELQIAAALELILQDRSAGRKIEPTIDLVTSGPEAPGIANRDTAVVVRELFAHARESVLVVGYAVYQGASVFEALAERMEKIPELDVKLFLDIARTDNDTTSATILVSRFAQRFRDSQWPKDSRLPAVFYDPRSVAERKRSSLHAKCVVVDAEQVFVSSANFTKAAQERNIEVGLTIRSHHLANRISHHFHLLSEHKLVVRAM